MSHFNRLFVDGYIRQFSNEHRLFMIIAHAINTIVTFFCGQLLSLQLYSIGDNYYGQQGIGNKFNEKHMYTLTKIKTFEKRIKDIISGYKCVYILFDDGTYECCGNNECGQLGIGHCSNGKTWTTMKDMQINRIYSVPNGSDTAFCITFDHTLYAVGYNYSKQFGIDTKQDSNSNWTHINTVLNMETVSNARGYTTFLSENGKIYVAGSDIGRGGLGLGKKTKQVSVITGIKTKTKFKDIYCGAYHTLAIDNNDCVWSWGYGSDGQLGNGDTNNGYIATKIKKLLNIKIRSIFCGWAHNLLLSFDNKVYSFGRNEWYECGNGTNKNVLFPELNQTLAGQFVTDIKCGFRHNIIKTKDNKYYLWGYNEYNQCLYLSDANPPKFIKKPLLFDSNYFGKDTEVIDIYAGWYETRVTVVVKGVKLD
eukprot:67283_1